MPPTLAEIQNHLEQGYFTDEDMATLGLEGWITVDQMQAEVNSLLPVIIPDDGSAARRRLQWEAEERGRQETKAAEERAALVKSIEDGQAAERQEIDERNRIIQAFIDSLNGTTEKLEPEDQETF